MERLKLQCDETPSNFAVKFNLRRYNPASLRRLTSGGDDDAERSAAYVAPDGDTEEMLAALFEEVLGPDGGVEAEPYHTPPATSHRETLPRV